MKNYFKKHTIQFIAIMAVFAVLSNFITGILTNSFSKHVELCYILEAICQYMIAAFSLILMVKWGYTKKSDRKHILMGFLAGTPILLYSVQNLLPLLLVEPAQFKIQWSIILAVIAAKFSVGLMEEAGIRGVLLPFLCEKWVCQKNRYLKAAFASALLFGCLHLTWSIREILFWGNISVEHIMWNLNQVYYTFCFGMLAAGVTMSARSLIPMVIYHSITDVTAYISHGLLPQTTYTYYYAYHILTIENVFEKYGILSGMKHRQEMVSFVIDTLFLVVGIILVKYTEKSQRNT